jgi:septal ring factor EnvC (AmiA/AmiB activator)
MINLLHGYINLRKKIYIFSSLEEENNGKKTLNELFRLRKELQQNISENDIERKQFEQTLNKLKKQNSQLEKELIEKEKNYINKNNKLINNLENEKKQQIDEKINEKVLF